MRLRQTQKFSFSNDHGSAVCPRCLRNGSEGHRSQIGGVIDNRVDHVRHSHFVRVSGKAR